MTLYNIPPGEEWIDFYKASETLCERLSLSRGEAERTLRGLCAGGTVRTLRAVYEVDGSAPVEPLEIIKPSEWLHDEVDLNHWLAKQQPERPKAVGKQPRIIRLLAQMWPNGVPDPADCPRKALKADLLKRDPGLKPLDEHTLKSAIEAYNADLKRS